MAYCPQCNAEIIFGLMGREPKEETENMKEIEKEYKKRGEKVIFAGCVITDLCPKCSIPLKESDEETS